MKQVLQQKKGLVKEVFDKVYKKYDLMNDLMSLGIHRLWKKEFLHMMNPSKNRKLIDVACGTGDISKLFIKAINNSGYVLCVDPNKNMISECRKNLDKYKNLDFKICNAEKLNVPNNSFDYYSISFGLRNTKNIDKSLKEAHRVLKKGGRFMCLEFSKIDNELINFFYQNYSKIIPMVGKYVVGSSSPYEYLVKSIKSFYNQEELINLIEQNGFSNVEYRNLSNGISAIHSGWKI